MNKLKHHGIPGQEWGKRRFQNEDGSLTPAGKERYGVSLSKAYENDTDDDYNLSRGTIVSRRTPSNKDDDDDKLYTYTYDYDNERDNSFYQQFGLKVNEYTLVNDSKLAGRKTLGKSFLDKMLSLDGSEDEMTMDTLDYLYDESCKRSGKKYVEDMFSVPFNPKNYSKELEDIGYDMVSRMLGSERHEKHDEKMKRRGLRDMDTQANDFGRMFVNDLTNDGYSGMRDYHDYGSAANVTTPTIFFNPKKTLERGESWIDELLNG